MSIELFRESENRRELRNLLLEQALEFRLLLRAKRKERYALRLLRELLLKFLKTSIST